MVGIAAAGFYLPRYTISAEEYRKALGKFEAPGIGEKRVPGYDEDEVTMAVEAGRRALDAAGIRPTFLVYGSSSRTPAMDVLATALGIEDAGRQEILGEPDAGVAALNLAVERTAAGGKDSLAVVSDAPRAFPGSPAEHPLGAAAVAFVVTANGPVRRTTGSGSTPGRDLLPRVGFAGAASLPLAFLDEIARADPGARLSVDPLVFDVAAKPAGDLDVRGALETGIPVTYDQYLGFRRYRPAPPGTEYSQGAYVSLEAYLGEKRARYRLVGERCASCGRVHFPPREVCLACGAQSWEPVAMSRTGRVYAFTVIGKGAAPSEFLELQQVMGEYATAVVQLPEGPRVAAMLTDVDPRQVRIGMPVRMVLRRIYEQEGVTRYGFKFAPA